jgi:penicillin-binding protein 1C
MLPVKKSYIKRFTYCLTGAALLALGTATFLAFQPPVPAFRQVQRNRDSLQLLDRQGSPLTLSYAGAWNLDDQRALHTIPALLQQAFIASEDKRFFTHGGVDWLARGSAVWDAIRHGQRIRGASTITEQVVRMLHPRPRSLWAKWIEGWEAMALERNASKAAILEMYLNQVPYASNRRGVVQAARLYFNRDITTLSTQEMLALAVLVRAPSRFDLRKHTISLERAIQRLGERLIASKALDHLPDPTPLHLAIAESAANAPQFVAYVRRHALQTGRLVTTLDRPLQRFITDLLEQRLAALAPRHVTHAAAVVVDHTTHQLLAWVSLGAGCREARQLAPGCQMDMVTSPRQPGSALKPFLYAAALDKGWDAATLIDDSPYSDTVGTGIHHFHNYSHSYYGLVTLRQALGNSLNIPALRTIQYVEPKQYLHLLQRLGFTSLSETASFYDEGLALGNGAVTLLELVQAYAALANGGMFQPLTFRLQEELPAPRQHIYSEAAATLIGHILSDPWARNLEFGSNSVLNLSTQTAVKTGTSTDYRDAWAVGYNHRYVIGLWMGNTDYTPTDGITGSLGPALALRAIFNQLTRDTDTAPLRLSPALIARDVCIDPAATAPCMTRTEYFLPGQRPETTPSAPTAIRIARPAHRLAMALDPRIPAEQQAFEMHLDGVQDGESVTWQVDGKESAMQPGASYLWPMQRGTHRVQATLWRDNTAITTTGEHRFVVK